MAEARGAFGPIGIRSLDVMMNELCQGLSPFKKKQKGYCIRRPLMITMRYSLLVHAFHESSGAMGQQFNNFLVNVCPFGPLSQACHFNYSRFVNVARCT